MAEQPNTVPALEEAYRKRLETKVSSVAVESYPDDPEDYRLIHQNGALLVAYRGAEYGPVTDTGETVQERTLLFDIVVLSRDLGGHGGALSLIEEARAALTGFRAPGFRKAHPRRERFLDHREGVWAYALTVAAVTIAAELPETVVGPALTRITLTSPHTTSEVTNG